MPEAIVHLVYHPRDSAWGERVEARLSGLGEVDVRTGPAAATAAPPDSASGAPRAAAVLLLSTDSLAPGTPLHQQLPVLSRRRRRGELELFPVVLGPIPERARARLAGVTARSLDGRPLADGSPQEVEAFLDRLGSEVGCALGLPGRRQAAASSFERIFERHYPNLVAFFGRRGLDPELSRDLAQETMIRVHRGLGGFEGRASERSWILKIATNVWQNWLRDHRGTQKRGAAERSLEELAEHGEPSQERGLWPRPAEDPERRLSRSQQRRRVRHRLGELSPLQRRCLLLWLDGWKYREIADEVGVSLQTVRPTLHKAKARLRKLLAAEGVDGGGAG